MSASSGEEDMNRECTNNDVLLDFLPNERVADDVKLPCVHASVWWRLELQFIAAVITALGSIGERNVRDLHGRYDHAA
jgi:hypothetical protein